MSLILRKIELLGSGDLPGAQQGDIASGSAGLNFIDVEKLTSTLENTI